MSSLRTLKRTEELNKPRGRLGSVTQYQFLFVFDLQYVLGYSILSRFLGFRISVST